jgi:hypothetical protein
MECPVTSYKKYSKTKNYKEELSWKLTYGGMETYNVLQYLKDSDDGVQHSVSETDPVSEMLCFLVFRIPNDGQSPETK